MRHERKLEDYRSQLDDNQLSADEPGARSRPQTSVISARIYERTLNVRHHIVLLFVCAIFLRIAASPQV